MISDIINDFYNELSNEQLDIIIQLQLNPVNIMNMNINKDFNTKIAVIVKKFQHYYNEHMKKKTEQAQFYSIHIQDRNTYTYMSMDPIWVMQNLPKNNTYLKQYSLKFGHDLILPLFNYAQRFMFEQLDKDIEKYFVQRPVIENVDRFGIILVRLDKDREEEMKQEEEKETKQTKEMKTTQQIYDKFKTFKINNDYLKMFDLYMIYSQTDIQSALKWLKLAESFEMIIFNQYQNIRKGEFLRSNLKNIEQVKDNIELQEEMQNFMQESVQESIQESVQESVQQPVQENVQKKSYLKMILKYQIELLSQNGLINKDLTPQCLIPGAVKKIGYETHL